MINWFRRPIGSQTSDKLQFLLKSQFWSSDKIKEYQWERLRQLLVHAVANVPYYRNLFQEIGANPQDIRDFEEFSKIPPLTKRDIQKSLVRMVSEGANVESLPLNSTGGSTGMPLNFYQDSNYNEWANAARLRAWKYSVGGDAYTLEGVLWGDIRDVGNKINHLKMLKNVFRDGGTLLNTFDLDMKSLNNFLRYYNFFKPKIVRGYASSLYYVAIYVQNYSVKLHKPGAVISTTEILHPRMRSKIEEVFGCKVTDSYGCREVSQIGTECNIHDGFHVVFENQYVEVVDSEIIVTNLNNYVMPFLRYKVGDLARSLNTEKCECGRSSPRLMGLLGRDNDNIELPNGKLINGEFFEFLFFGIKNVIQYQVVYHKNNDYLEVRIHLSDNSTDVGEIIKNEMRKKFDYQNVNVEYADDFYKTPAGKLRFVYSVD